MYRYIISLFILILFLGCENRDSFDNIIAKLKAQKDKNITKTTVIVPNVIQKKATVEQNLTLVNKEKDTKQKKKISKLSLKTIDGKEIKLKFFDNGIKFQTYKNKIILLDIFTTWCPPCIESIPHLVKIQKQYKKDIQIIGIVMEENKRDSELLQFKEKYHINYPLTNSKENFTLVDTWGGVSGYPTIIIFDKNGTYFNHYNGSPPIEMLESDIKKVLRKK